MLSHLRGLSTIVCSTFVQFQNSNNFPNNCWTQKFVHLRGLRTFVCRTFVRDNFLQQMFEIFPNICCVICAPISTFVWRIYVNICSNLFEMKFQHVKTFVWLFSNFCLIQQKLNHLRGWWNDMSTFVRSQHLFDYIVFGMVIWDPRKWQTIVHSTFDEKQFFYEQMLSHLRRS